MGRPPLSEADKIKSVGVRLAKNMRRIEGSDCWAHVGGKYYSLGRDRRLRPRTAMWLVAGNQLPDPPHLYYVGQKDSCVAEECINPAHLEVKANVSKVETQLGLEEYARKHGGIVAPPVPDGAIQGKRFLEYIWLDVAKWETYCRSKGKDDAWVASMRDRMIAQIEVNQAKYSDLVSGAGG